MRRRGGDYGEGLCNENYHSIIKTCIESSSIGNPKINQYLAAGELMSEKASGDIGNVRINHISSAARRNRQIDRTRSCSIAEGGK